MKITLKFYVAFLLCLMFFFPANKGLCDVDNEFSLWNRANIYAPISDRIKLNFDIQNRVYFENEVFDPDNLFFFRPSVGVELPKGFTLWNGYGYFNYADTEASENRLWHQLQHEKSFSKLWLVNRFRLEERFFDDVGPFTDNFSTRGKYLIRMMFPFTSKKHWFFVLQDELSFNFNDALSGFISDGYDSNRTFLGLNYRPNDYITLETGYQFEHQHFSDINVFGASLNIPEALNHSVLFNVYLSTPQLFKKGVKPQTILPPF